MKKILFEHFEHMMLFDVIANHACIEIAFCVDNLPAYDECWLGKTIDKETNREVYWYGLVPDGSQASDFNSFHEFIDAPVFQGKNIKQIWNSITLIAIDGCDIDWRLSHYLNFESGPNP